MWFLTELDDYNIYQISDSMSRKKFVFLTKTSWMWILFGEHLMVNYHFKVIKGPLIGKAFHLNHWIGNTELKSLQKSLHCNLPWENGDCYWRKWRLKPHCHIRDIEKGFQYMKASYPIVRDFFWVGINWINLTLCMTLAAPALIMIYMCFRCWKYMDLG